MKYCMKRCMKHWLRIAACLLVVLLIAPVRADEEKKPRGREWQEGGIFVRELSVYPAPEPMPALKYRLVTHDIELTDRNAAVYYLKAMGFIEQYPALRELTRRTDKWREEAQSQGKDQFPPWEWIEMPLDELPLDEVKDFLGLAVGQERYLRLAAYCRRCDFQNDIRGAENPVGTLLPEIQAMRTLARYQALRCKVALAEKRYDDAIRIMRECCMMARHMGQHDCLVSALVGMAIVGMANVSQYPFYVEQPGAPNLYWALATMPKLLVDMTAAWATEGRLLYEQFPQLKEVDETPRSVEYWRLLTDDLLSKWHQGFGDAVNLRLGGKDDPAQGRAMVAGFCIAAYPSAKRYLVQTWGIPERQVDEYPVMQVVALAALRSWDELCDEELKWIYVPWPQGRGGVDFRERLEQIGPAAMLANLLLPALQVAHPAQVRTQRDLAMMQTVESLRAHVAEHGRLPASLGELRLPAPVDPFTGQPFYYRCHDQSAVLESAIDNFFGLRWIVRLATSK